jgi:hypothetical protein
MNLEKTKIQTLIMLLCVVSFIVTSLIYFMTSYKTDYKKEKKWTYQIKGEVTVLGKKRPAIWYTDTLDYIQADSCGYRNSDGSRVDIKSPYILIDHSLDR